MIITVSAVAASAAAFLFGSGYLVGARRGFAARRALLAAREHDKSAVATLEGRLEALACAAAEASAARVQVEDAARVAARTQEGAAVDALRVELDALSRLMRKREADDATLRTELRSELASLAKTGSDPVRFERELRRIVAPMIERQNDSHGLRELVQKTLSPMLERERLGRELAQLEGGSTLGELPRLLDGIAQKGGFSSVVLSDDVGLPLAASSGAQSVDWLAGMASLVLTLVERSERSGEPRPIGVVVHDESNQMLLHRIFRVGADQFLLTAVTRGKDVAPSALDPALAKLERVLARPTLHA